MRRVSLLAFVMLFAGLVSSRPLAGQSFAGSVEVTPDGASTTQPSSFSGLEYVFNVHNSTGAADTYALSCTRTGQVSSCSASPSQVTIPAGDNASVTVTYATGNTGSGRFTLRAYSDDTGMADTGWVNVTVATPATFPTVSLAPYNGAVKDLGKCVAACFDQVMTFVTPSYTSLGTPRSFGLTYSSATAQSTPVIEVDVTPPASGTATRYDMDARRASDNSLLTLLNGQTSVSYTPRTGTNRLAAALSASANGFSGISAIDVRVTVTAQTASGPRATTMTTTLVVVNRASTNYGAGVWPSGVQQHVSTALGPLVVESDGSYFLFRGGARPGGTTSSVASNRRTYLDGSYVDFDAVSGMMLRAVDIFGNTTTYHWTGAKLDSITDPMGHRMRMTYNPGTGLITSVSYPASRTTSFQHDGSSRLTRVTDPDTRYTQLGYTGNLVTSQTTRSSVTWDYTYDGLNRLATAQAPSIPLHDGSSSRPSGALVSHLRVVWQPSIAGTTGTPKAAVNPDTVRATLTDPLGVATKYKVDRFMAATQIDEPLARVTIITRDTMARATKIVTPSGHDTRYTWGDGVSPPSEPVSTLLLWKEEDVTRGRTTTYKYTAGNQVKEATGAGLDQRFTYHASGALKAVYIGGSSSATDSMVYDARGRMIVRIYGDSLRRDSTWYDATWGNLEKTKNARGLVTRYHFDNAGRTDSVYAPDHATQAYSSTTYGVLNEVATTRNALGHVTTYAYNFDGTLQSVTDPKSQVYNFGYNALGALVAQKDLANPAIADSVFYDLGGQARRVKTRRGSVVQNSYDALGRLTDQLGTLGADTARRQFSYDSVGRRIVGWNNEARDTLFLDQMGRVSTAVTRLGSGPVWRFTYTYDALDRRTLRGLSKDGSGQSYGGALAVFDGFGSQTTLREGGVNVEFTRTNVSRLPTKQTFTQVGTGLGNWWMGTVFDTLQQMPVRDSFSLASLNTYFSDRATRDSLDRLATLFVGDTTVGGGRRFRYDRTGRLLTSCIHPTFATPYCIDEYGQLDYPWAHVDAYAYDLAGNRVDPSAGAVVGTGNRTTQFGGVTYSYNASGQITTRAGSTSTWTYGWSPLDQLTSATASGQSVTYGYDAFGRRVRRTANGTTEYYLHDGEQVAIDLDASQVMLREYGWRPGVDQLLSMRLADGTTGMVVNDIQQAATPEGLVNVVSGSALADYGNTAWGKPSDPSSYPAAYKLRYRMGGREYDEVSGLYYMRARYYDPALGKFLSEDPIGIEAGLNLYAYAGNDPINRRDPTGLFSECVKRVLFDGEAVGFTILPDGSWDFQYAWVWVCTGGDIPPLGPVGNDATKMGGSSGSTAFASGVGGPSCLQARVHFVASLANDALIAEGAFSLLRAGSRFLGAELRAGPLYLATLRSRATTSVAAGSVAIPLFGTGIREAATTLRAVADATEVASISLGVQAGALAQYYDAARGDFAEGFGVDSFFLTDNALSSLLASCTP